MTLAKTREKPIKFRFDRLLGWGCGGFGVWPSPHQEDSLLSAPERSTKNSLSPQAAFLQISHFETPF